MGASLSPIGFAVDPSGVLYVPDRGVVRKVDERGILSIFATFGTGIDVYRLIPKPEGGLYASSSGGVSSIDPTGRVTTVAAGFSAESLAVDADGNLYVASGGFEVRRVARDGSISTVAGNGTDDVGDGGQASDAILRFARDVAFDGSGVGYVTEDAYNRVRRVDRSGVLTTLAGTRLPGFSGDGGPATAAALDGPSRVVADGGGNVYILDSNNRRIRRVDGSGIITTVAGNGGGGQYGATGDGGPATAAAIGLVWDLALDGAGNLYLSGGASVRKVDALGIITTVAGTGESGFSGDGGPATAARLGAPTGIDVDATGTLAIVDFGRIRRVTPDGRITTIATLIKPSSIASDRAGGWFVASRDQVHRVNGAGQVLVAGTGEDDLTDDVGPATRTPLSRISGIAFDGTDLFIAAQTRIRRVAMAASSPPAPAPSPAAGWGMNTYGQTSGSATTNPVLAPSGTVDATAVAAGWYHSLAVTPGGGVRAWGWNHFGQLGRGSTTGSTALAVPGLSNVRSVAAGLAHSLALKADGTVWAWGYNGQGQLGTGSTTDSPVPVQVQGLTRVVAIAAGGVHSLAVDSGGRVDAWGWNGLGALGQGHTYNRPVPTAVPFNVSNDAVGVAGGTYHSLVVWRDGTVWTFGWNGVGQLGNGSTTDSSRPTRIPGLSGVAEAAGGIAHSLARGHNGEVWAWGWNVLGQLGDGTTNDRRTPVPVTGLTNVRSVAAGGYHSLAALDSGAVRSWGWNGAGQLGTGSTADSLRPTPAGTAGKSEVAAGVAHSLTR